MKDLYQKKRQEGFTIIEVMIVLAIAGLIMVIVFVAIPQLQRSQRNTAMKEVANRIATEVNTYAGNNSGDLPNSAATFGEVTSALPLAAGGTTFTSRYLTGIDINDPRSGNTLYLDYDTTTTPAPALPANGPRTLRYHNSGATGTGFRCQGESVVAGNGPRSFAITVVLEGGAIYCRDNQ